MIITIIIIVNNGLLTVYPPSGSFFKRFLPSAVYIALLNASGAEQIPETNILNQT